MKKVKLPSILRNSFTGIIASVISTLSLYVIRIILSRVLGDEIYGVNSIFVNVVNAFLILEMGMSTAMIIVMYKPVETDDREKIKSILGFYKTFYRIFCLVLLAVGVVVDLFFLHKFIKTTLPFFQVQLYFFLYLLSIIVKYLWSYKNCLLYANKQNSVISLSTIAVTIVFTLLEILSIVIFKNYWIYLALFLLQNASLNAVCIIITNRQYPYIKEKKTVPLDSETKKQLVKIIKPMFIQRLANQIQDASSVIILGAIGISAVVVGYFSNYVWVVHACQTIFNQIGSAFTTSFGNFFVKNNDNDQEQFEYYKKSRFFMSWIAIMFSALYLCLIQTFITLFFGSNYCMSISMAVLFACYVFVLLNSSVNLAVQNAIGAHYLDTWEMVAQVAVGLIMAVLLGLWLGTIGVVLGMLIPILIFTGLNKGEKILKNIFKMPRGTHLFMFVKEFISFVIVAGSSYAFYAMILKPKGILSFLLSAFVIFIISNVELLLLNCRSKYLVDLKQMVKRILHVK